MPVGGSRHYPGGGLGQEGGWACPSCGADNDRPIVQGCAHCGAGTGARHIGTEPPPPPTPDDDEPEQLGLFDRWALAHPHATLEQAFTDGFREGLRVGQQQRPTPSAESRLDPQGKVARTIVAALGYFADQVLRSAPQEVQTGEWCSLDEVRTLIHQLTTTGEVVHG